MSRSRANRPARRIAALTVAALCIAAPKCLLCVAGYLGLAATLGLGTQALCGAPTGGSITPAVLLALGGGAVAAAATWHWRVRRAAEHRVPPPAPGVR